VAEVKGPGAIPALSSCEALAQLPYREVWCVDFEFRVPDGECPEPHCMVGRELRSGRELRLWADDLRRLGAAPFPIGPETLFVAYYASAELGCFLALGWPLPAHILDLYPEFRVETNGLDLPCGRGLLGALQFYGLDHMDAAEKGEMRDLAMRGGPYSATEQEALIAYCAADVAALGKLLSRMVRAILARQRDASVALGQALLRGRYMAAVARMERTGIPVDVPALELIRGSWADIKLALIREVDARYGVYEGSSFRVERFGAYLTAMRIPWPRLASGVLALDERYLPGHGQGVPTAPAASRAAARAERAKAGASGRRNRRAQPDHVVRLLQPHGSQPAEQQQIPLRPCNLGA
jgi:hypothetical protein